ncbi:DUF2599 domain-containing protein [Eggerthella sinensis]|uniref:DUF2599 domain-containing protein n=2 Tax=Eggerthella TaxID=84111 RepID=UPI00266D0F63|nr:DUF2599 domain-containing protein [Eggerthella sinensis]
MRRLVAVFAVALMCCLLCAPAVAHADESNIYAPFDSFSELHDAYIVAVEDGDENTIAWLEDIGRSSLRAEIEASETAPQPRPYVRDYFDYAEFRGSSVSNANLAMMPKGNFKYAWSDVDKLNGWNTIYFNFSNDYRWANTSTMKEQFYCHARLVYSVIAGEWNLEPWRTSMNPFTCN